MMRLPTLKKHTKFMVAAIAAIGLWTSASAASAEVTLRIVWPSADTKTDPYAIAAHTFAEQLEELAPGKFKVAFFPNHQLGDETDTLQGMQLGTIDMGVYTNNQVALLHAPFQVYDLPFLFSSYEQVYSLMDGQVGQKLLADLGDKGIIGLGSPVAGFRNVINNVRPVKTPKDLSGMKLRMPPVAIFMDSFRALGSNPVPMEWSQCFTAVQQGTIDGLEIPLPVIFSNKYPEVAKHLSLTRHMFNSLSLLMSKQTFDRLDPALQKAVKEAAVRAVGIQRKRVEEGDTVALKAIADKGMKVNEIEDVAAFRAAVKPVYDAYRKKLGAELVDMAVAATSK